MPRQDVERLDHRGKKHRGVNIAPFDMKAETVGDQRHADHQEEAQRQHQNRRIAVDERRQRPHGDHHHPDRHDDGYDHDRKILGHAHGRDDAVDREDDVDHDDLNEAGDEAERRSRLLVIILVIRVDAVVDFARRLPDQEQAARQQQQVAHRKGVSEHRGQRLREMHHPRRRSEQRQAEHERQGQARICAPSPAGVRRCGS